MMAVYSTGAARACKAMLNPKQSFATMESAWKAGAAMIKTQAHGEDYADSLHW
jgi:hypothetical protein